jgi:hypothetical protein
MQMVVRAYPLPAGRKELVEFAAAVSTQHAARLAEMYRRHGADHESWHLQEIAGSSWVICCTRLKDAAGAADSYGAATEEFDSWFKKEVLRLCGVDPNKTPLGPESTQIFSWSDGAGVGTFDA